MENDSAGLLWKSGVFYGTLSIYVKKMSQKKVFDLAVNSKK